MMILVVLVILFFCVWYIISFDDIGDAILLAIPIGVLALFSSIVVGLIISWIDLENISKQKYDIQSYTVNNGVLRYTTKSDDIGETENFTIVHNDSEKYIIVIKKQSKYKFLKWIFIGADDVSTEIILNIEG